MNTACKHNDNNIITAFL